MWCSSSARMSSKICGGDVPTERMYSMPRRSRSTASTSTCMSDLNISGTRLADAQREEPLVVRQALEEQDAVGQHLRVTHLVDRLGARVRRQRR